MPPTQVMELLRLLVKAGPNSDLKRLMFSNFFLLLSFLEVDVSAPSSSLPQTAATAASATGADRHQRNVDLGSKSGAGCGCGGVGGSGGDWDGEACGRRLYFASPVARLMAEVVDGDVVLVTSVSDQHLMQLTMAATGSR